MAAFIKRILVFSVSLVFHLVALAVIFYFWLPIGRWYWNQVPALGIDLFNSVAYVTYLLHNFSLPMDGWKYTWFSGIPLFRDYPTLYFYLILPLTKFFSTVRAVQIFALAANFTAIAAAYFLFATLSRNRVLAVVLALGVAYSANTYRALVWAGGIPFFTTQAMFPLVLLLIIKFLQNQNRSWLVVAGLVSGLGVMAHPQSFINFIFPAVLILLVFSYIENERFFSLVKIKNLIIYGIVTSLVGFPQIYQSFFLNFILRIAGFFHINLLGIAPPAATKPLPVAMTDWIYNQFFVSFSDTNQALFHLLPILAVSCLFGLILAKTRLKAVLNTLAIGLICGWVIGYIYLLAIGIDLYHGGWEAFYKLYWAVPVAMGMASAQLWGVFASSIKERFDSGRLQILAPLLVEVISGIIFLLLTVSFFSFYTRGVINQIINASSITSPFPEAVGVRLTTNEQNLVKAQAKPSFLDDSPSNYRLYSNDQTFNLWWNSYFTTPLARGYIDPPQSLKDKWGFFWMDAAFSRGKKDGTSLGDDWYVPDWVVNKNISFLLDWYAVKYIEGNHKGPGGVGGLPKVLISDQFIDRQENRIIQGAVEHFAKTPQRGVWQENQTQTLSFFKVKDNQTSPIHQATNAPVVLVIGGEDGFDIIIHYFGMMGLSSKDVILAQGPKYIDNMPSNQLANFDAVFLYKYDYKNYSKSWEKIDNYLKSGGKVFIDTGSEVKESSSIDLPANFSKNLPDIFPINQTKRGDLGSSWEAEIDKTLLTDVNPDNFSPFIYDNKPWNISYPADKNSELRSDTTTLVNCHGYPIVIEKVVGQGKIIWSGLNLPYHALYNYNADESNLLVNIYKRLIDFGGQPVVSKLQWSAEKRTITSQGAKGILIKEEAFPGWQAKISGQAGSSGLNIYKVGPTSPGFMYVRVPTKWQSQPFEVTFTFKGSWESWITYFISLFTTIFCLDYIFFGKRLFNLVILPLWSKIRRQTGAWWEKDEET